MRVLNYLNQNSNGISEDAVNQHFGAIEKAEVYPPTPQVGLYKHHKINKSPLRFREASAKQSWGI
jgi:hypothetical protein